MRIHACSAHDALRTLSAALIRQHTQRQAAQLLTDGIVRFRGAGIDELIELFFDELQETPYNRPAIG